MSLPFPSDFAPNSDSFSVQSYKDSQISIQPLIKTKKMNSVIMRTSAFNAALLCTRKNSILGYMYKSCSDRPVNVRV
ncbi:hypothetical protein DPMN_008876 [Dreissena polymorpha]|uniref:Uncharacterized protein n=1 Tax=Dreissena polymorpha TaxID=45954 RepID=A0A9D4MZ99_DREPO|nr:hypothetical protein DPMN_008876 [Dreissena polymorpha]